MLLFKIVNNKQKINCFFTIFFFSNFLDFSDSGVDCIGQNFMWIRKNYKEIVTLCISDDNLKVTQANVNFSIEQLIFIV